MKMPQTPSLSFVAFFPISVTQDLPREMYIVRNPEAWKAVGRRVGEGREWRGMGEEEQVDQ